jgi:hypothetical protein
MAFSLQGREPEIRKRPLLEDVSKRSNDDRGREH